MSDPKPYTVVMDWDSSRGDREAVAFYVWAHNSTGAYNAASSLAVDRYGNDADYLYSVMAFEGHPKQVEE